MAVPASSFSKAPIAGRDLPRRTVRNCRTIESRGRRERLLPLFARGSGDPMDSRFPGLRWLPPDVPASNRSGTRPQGIVETIPGVEDEGLVLIRATNRSPGGRSSTNSRCMKLGSRRVMSRRWELGRAS